MVLRKLLFLFLFLIYCITCNIAFECDTLYLINFYSDSGQGLKGYNYTYNSVPAGISIQASGYSILSTPNKPTQLVQKNSVTEECEKGLGLIDDAGKSFEIDNLHYVQFDFRGLQSAFTFSSALFSMGSVQQANNEGFEIYGSNKLGQLGDFLYGAMGSNNCSMDAYIPNYDQTQYSFYSIKAQGPNYPRPPNIVASSVQLLSYCPPSSMPSKMPIVVTTSAPTITPSRKPTTTPSLNPSISPSSSPSIPSNAPSLGPSSPTAAPSLPPTVAPSFKPTSVPSFSPSSKPSVSPSINPASFSSFAPSSTPTTSPSVTPSRAPSFAPSAPTESPSLAPSRSPTVSPSASPSVSPSSAPSNAPTTNPSSMPSQLPTYQPSRAPTSSPVYAISALSCNGIQSADFSALPRSVSLYTAYFIVTQNITGVTRTDLNATGAVASFNNTVACMTKASYNPTVTLGDISLNQVTPAAAASSTTATASAVLFAHSHSFKSSFKQLSRNDQQLQKNDIRLEVSTPAVTELVYKIFFQFPATAGSLSAVQLAIFRNLTSQLTNKVVNGEFDIALHAYCEAHHCMPSAAADTAPTYKGPFTLLADAFTPTSSPVVSVRDNSASVGAVSSDNWILIGFMAVLFLVCLALFIVFCFYKDSKGKQDKSKTNPYTYSDSYVYGENHRDFTNYVQDSDPEYISDISYDINMFDENNTLRLQQLTDDERETLRRISTVGLPKSLNEDEMERSALYQEYIKESFDPFSQQRQISKNLKGSDNDDDGSDTLPNSSLVQSSRDYERYDYHQDEGETKEYGDDEIAALSDFEQEQEHEQESPEEEGEIDEFTDDQPMYGYKPGPDGEYEHEYEHEHEYVQPRSLRAVTRSNNSRRSAGSMNNDSAYRRQSAPDEPLAHSYESHPSSLLDEEQEQPYTYINYNSNIDNNDGYEYKADNNDETEFNIDDIQESEYNIDNNDGYEYKADNYDETEFNIDDIQESEYNIDNNDGYEYKADNNYGTEYKVDNNDETEFNIDDIQEIEYNIDNNDGYEYKADNNDGTEFNIDNIQETEYNIDNNDGYDNNDNDAENDSNYDQEDVSEITPLPAAPLPPVVSSALPLTRRAPMSFVKIPANQALNSRAPAPGSRVAVPHTHYRHQQQQQKVEEEESYDQFEEAPSYKAPTAVLQAYATKRPGNLLGGGARGMSPAGRLSMNNNLHKGQSHSVMKDETL